MKNTRNRTIASNVLVAFISFLLATCVMLGIAAHRNEMTSIRTGIPLSDTSDLPSRDHPLETVIVPANAVTLDSREVSVDTIERNENGYIDWSTQSEGYILVEYTAPTTKTIKCTVTSSENRYIYRIEPGRPTSITLTDGDGAYKVSLLENTSGSSYRVKATASFCSKMRDPFCAFLASNPYADYADAPATVALAAELTKDCKTNLEKVSAIYGYVVSSLTYDYYKAETVAPGYLPVLDEVLGAGTGICFDYAALTTGMLRSQGVPCKLVIGYAGESYHAWISVWSEETGWIKDSIHFDSNEWKRLDPTYASTGNGSAKTLAYIGDGSNYVACYSY